MNPKITFSSVLMTAMLWMQSVAPAQSFVHPGGLHTQADLDRMKSKVAAGEHPWIDGWNTLIADRKAQNDYKARPLANMGGSRQRAQDDATAAYLNAIRWSVSGDKSFAECAVRNLNGWSATVDQIPKGPDQPGLSGIPIGSFALAAEVLRTYPGWGAADQERFKKMLRTYFYPVCDSFLTKHNNSDPTRYWANWDTANILALVAIGVFCDDRAIYDQGVEYFKNGKGMGSIRNAVPFLYPGGLGQWQEAGRDFAHTMGGKGLLAEACQVAWNQGLDLFGYDDNRLLKGAEYAAQYTLWKGVPYTFYTNADRANQYYISTNYHGRLAASHFELLYNHYVVRKGLKAQNVKSFAELRRPEPGETDIFGYGTLTFTLDAAASPYPAFAIPPVPRDLAATSGIGRVDLAWSPSGGYTAHGYEVFRSEAGGGPFTSIYATNNWTTPAYTDTKVESGKTYHYVVAALSQAGSSGKSVPVSSTPAAGGPLPEGWTHATLGEVKADGGTKYADAAGHSFVIDAAGGGMGGTADACKFVSRACNGDFTITARLIGRNGDIKRMGVMIRDGLDAKAKALALTLGDVGGRQTRFGTRAKVGEKMTSQSGNDYTWLPIWFRVQRVGDNFSSFQSPDGIEWFRVGESKISIPSSALVGLGVSGSGSSLENPPNALFDHVTIESLSPTPPAPPHGLKVTGLPDQVVGLAWENATGSTRNGVKVEASENGLPFYEIADLAPGATRFENTGIRNSASLRYRIRAYNRGGYSAYSNVAP